MSNDVSLSKRFQWWWRLFRRISIRSGGEDYIGYDGKNTSRYELENSEKVQRKEASVERLCFAPNLGVWCGPTIIGLD